jgi:hypothetical protein
MSGHSSYYKKRRTRLLEKDPFCYWCRKPLVLIQLPPNLKGPIPDNFPTIEHLNSRFLGKRPKADFKTKTLVLACPPCNFERGRLEVAKHPFRQHWKSSSFPPPFEWLGWPLKRYRRILRAYRRHIQAKNVAKKLVSGAYRQKPQRER